jgi:hypothetical protein
MGVFLTILVFFIILFLNYLLLYHKILLLFVYLRHLYLYKLNFVNNYQNLLSLIDEVYLIISFTDLVILYQFICINRITVG